MNKSRIAQTLRNLSVNPSLESDVDANIETGPAGEGAVKEKLEEAQTIQADAEIGDAEGESLTVKTVEVGEGCEVETAETEVTASAESADVSGDVTTGDGEQIVKAVADAVDETPADGAGAPGEDEVLTVKTVDVGERSELESAETTIEDATDFVTVSNEGLLTISQEGFKGAVKGFALGTVGVILSPLTLGLSNGAVDAGQKQKRLRIANEINVLAKRLADLKNGDIEKAKKEGIKVPKEDVENVDAGQVVKSFLLGLILPFHSTYQGHKVEEMEIELAAKITELKIEMARNGISTESLDDASAQAAVAAAAAVAEGAAAAAEAAAAAASAIGGESTEVATEVAEVVEETVAEVAEEAGEAAAEVVDDIEAGEEVAAIEEGSTEIEELDSDIGEIEGHAEKYEQAAATMESLVDALRDAQQTGGLSAQSARFFTIGFESVGVNLIGKPFENERGETAVPSLESFGGSMRRDQATQISMEAAEGWLQKIWEVLKRTFQQIKDWVLKFIKAIFDQGERYYQRAEKILAATKSSRSAAKASTVNLGRTGSKIAIGKEVDIAHLSDLKKIAEEAGVRSVAASRAIIQIRQNLNESIGKIAKSGSGEVTDEDMNAFVAGMFSTSEARSSGDLRSAAFSDTYADGDQKGFATKVMPGNVRLAVIDPMTEGSVLKAMMSALRGWRVVVVPQEGGSDEAIEAKTLTIFEIQTVANEVKSIIEAARKAKNDLKEEALDLGAINVPSDVSEDRARVVSSMAQSIGKSVSRASSSIGQLLKYTVGTSGHYLDYAVLSLKQYQIQIDPTGEGAKKQAEEVAQAA